MSRVRKLQIVQLDLRKPLLNLIFKISLSAPNNRNLLNSTTIILGSNIILTFMFYTLQVRELFEFN